MNTDLETPMAALFQHLQLKTAGQFKTTGRRLKPWTELALQPAMFLRKTGTTDAHDFAGLITTTIEAEIWIYSQSGKDPNAVPDVELSRLDKLVRDAFEPDTSDERFTLKAYSLDGSELVYWCRIEGSSAYQPGDFTDWGISHIPVRITLP